PPQELAREVARPEIEQQRPRHTGARHVLPMSARQRPRDSDAWSELVVVLERRVVQQALLERAQRKEPQRLATPDRNRELASGVVGLAAVVGEGPRAPAAGIARLEGGGGVHRIGVEPPRRIQPGEQADAATEWTIRLRHAPRPPPPPRGRSPRPHSRREAAGAPLPRSAASWPWPAGRVPRRAAPARSRAAPRPPAAGARSRP